MGDISAKVTVDHITVQSQNKLRKATLSKTDEVDYSMFGAREIRDVLKSRAHCLRAGFPPNHVIIKTLNEIRDQYIQRVGLATYLSQMLGSIANVPVQQCTLFGQNGRRIQVLLNGNYNQPLQRFIAKHFQWDNLPTEVEARKESKPGHIEARYL